MARVGLEEDMRTLVRLSETCLLSFAPECIVVTEQTGFGAVYIRRLRSKAEVKAVISTKHFSIAAGSIQAVGYWSLI